ncbi:hypothetical protein V6N11_030917 [Hibiscus sabdariffa]|uniref:Endonuclease/exonuclease/phosphatase domain-containing protein n=1 Tax=Hibiscus sabdariffa TaxID=183260 RepID=A0ABR2A377_9ROSI
MKDETPWFCTFVYGCPSSAGKKEVWSSISKLRRDDSEPWCLIGDFNEILAQEEKLGGCPYEAQTDDPFQSFMNDHGLIDMPLKGGPFTWNNKRTDDGSILEKIDRILFNSSWSFKFQKALGIIEPTINSDHSPLLLLLRGMNKNIQGL